MALQSRDGIMQTYPQPVRHCKIRDDLPLLDCILDVPQPQSAFRTI